MKEYEVNFSLNYTEVVEAENKADAEQQFSELFSSSEDLLEYGTTTVKRAGNTADKKTHLLIDLYSGVSTMITDKDAAGWKADTQRKKGAKIVWRGEEHILVQL